MKKFDWKTFGKGNLVVWCKNEKEAIDFCKASHKNGFDWHDGYSREVCTMWDGSIDMCYSRRHHCSRHWYIKNQPDREIVEWADYISKDNTAQPDFVHPSVERILTLLVDGVLTIEEAAGVLTRLISQRDNQEKEGG